MYMGGSVTYSRVLSVLLGLFYVSNCFLVGKNFFQLIIEGRQLILGGWLFYNLGYVINIRGCITYAGDFSNFWEVS